MFTEGWIEFKDKRIAKAVARSLNGQIIGKHDVATLQCAFNSPKCLHCVKDPFLM